MEGLLLLSLALTLLLTLLALTLLRSINHALNSWSTNNWRLTAHPGWVWGEEIAVVTGGAGDIGLAIVAGLLGAGMRVAILDINPLPPAPSLPPIIPHSLSTGSLKIYKCDITSPQEIQSAASLIRDAWPDKKKGPSILINNAGTIQTSLILDKEESDLRRVVDVNMLSHWFTTKVFLPSMIECNKGHILSVASLASYVALPTCVDYSATKAGILAFHEGLGCEIKHIYKAPGVLTSIVLPDFVRTQMTRRYWDEVEAAGGTLLTVKEVADPVLKQIFSRRGGQIIVPRSRTVVSLLRGFPNWMQEFVRDVIGRADRDLKSKWAR
ncbi:estradiol 17-beta-dehydrogenase [Xylariaceae sp. FL0594]|nr:estradiol 17-beta-dehydrogenase [Xylariaceae sp. FL0594]